MKKILLSCFALLIFLSFFEYSFSEEFEYDIQVVTIAENLTIPWSIDFTPDGRIFFTERIGNVRIIENDQLLDEPALTVQVGVKREGGLLGIALDPNFEENHYVYLYYTYKTSFLPNNFLGEIFNKVVRYTESNNKLSNEEVLVDKIPGSITHDGGRIRFGPDGYLYITTGEIKMPELSQDLNSLGGKFLRINSDGTIPDDNPFENSPVYSYGHRNPQGFDWDKKTGKLISSEHGPSGEYGNGKDEINIVKAGKNYGWPLVAGDDSAPNYTSPLYHTGETETWAPSGASFYNSDKFPDWKGKFFVANLFGKHLRMLDIDLENEKITSNQSLLENSFGRLRDVVEGPDGNLYILTSNQDGRGIPASNDDRILKIISVSRIDQLMIENILSPLKQIKQGVLVDNVVCKQSYELLLKISSGNPGCVKSTSVEKLISYGWGKKIN